MDHTNDPDLPGRPRPPMCFCLEYPDFLTSQIPDCICCAPTLTYHILLPYLSISSLDGELLESWAHRRPLQGPVE